MPFAHFHRLRSPVSVPLLLTLIICSKRGAWAQGGPALVELKPVVHQPVSETQTFVATVKPSRRAIVGSAVDGRVVEFPVNDGDRVDDGQMLAQLLTETISLELKAAEEELSLRESELEEAIEGPRDEEIEQARARMESAKASAEYRAAQKDRVVSLHRQGRAATDQQLDEATSLALEARETYLEATAAYELMLEGTRPEQISQARARLAMQQAVVDKLRDQIKKHTVISRFAGYVVDEHTEIGQWVSRGDPVAEVVALDEVDVEAKVVEQHVPFVRIGDRVRVNVPAVSTEPFEGKVVSVVPQADVRSRTFPVNVRVQNIIDEDGQPKIKSGMLAEVTLPTGPRREATLVPKDSLVLNGRQTAIWIVDLASARSVEGTPLKTAPARQIPVQRGAEEGNLIQVTGDLPESAAVVVLGNERLVPSRSGDPTMVRWKPTGE